MPTHHSLPPTRPTTVVAIDGPAGAGKSTVAKLLADRLGFEFLDTGAMYRCVTLAMLRVPITPSETNALQQLASDLQIELSGSVVRMNGEDVSDAIRTPEVSQAIGGVADNILVREILSDLQRRWASGKRVVTEGRDQGSVVFQDSRCKVFLVASPEERARRRVADLAQRGIDADLQSVLDQQNARDLADYSRPVGALIKAPDAVEISTDGISMHQVVDKLERLVQARLGQNLSAKFSSTKP
ncbi:(d)CMP kinase [Aureliella helgolandensis]|uniref:Cytidylate kinase n=1 Tax=Aureliella helgolandensis TaxID=2527968 RepID=A0A518G760_9BACT|nr:(d)CMP kinase [Aureliella helgolandensis]QDV24427.1 Cytidylate kinase [Aureliella helgolandensis]